MHLTAARFYEMGVKGYYETYHVYESDHVDWKYGLEVSVKMPLSVSLQSLNKMSAHLTVFRNSKCS